MIETEKAINAPEGKRSLDIPAAEEAGKATTVTPTSAKKLKKTDDSSNAFRAWSHQVDDAADGGTCTTYTLKCTFGDASTPNSYFKSQKVSFLKEELERRGLPSNGTKAALLSRLQTELPSLTFEIDGREVLQRVVNSMVYFFQWDNTHLYECKMPKRGDVRAGVGKLWASLPLDMGLAIKMGNVSADPRQQDARLQKRLAQLGITNEMIRRIQSDPEALGDVRKLSGSAFDPKGFRPSLYGDEEEDEKSADGGKFSLEELALKKGDRIKLTYDFGDDNKFVVEVQDVKENVPVLPEVAQYEHDTRVKLLSKGQAMMRKQYDDGCYDPFYYTF